MATNVVPDTDKPVVGAEPAPESLTDYSRKWVAGWTPPDLWDNGRPSLKSTWLWARYGEHLPDDDTVRAASRVTAVLRLPIRALLLYLDWVFERDSRVVAAALLALVVIQAVFHPFF